MQYNADYPNPDLKMSIYTLIIYISPALGILEFHYYNNIVHYYSVIISFLWRRILSI